MSYAAEGVDVRAEVLQGATDGLVYWAKDDGAPLDVAEGTVTVLAPDGRELVPETAADVAAGGRLSLEREWSFDVGEDYVALWEFEAGGLARADRQLFDVVRTKLPVLIDTSDLLEFYPDLDRHLKAVGVTDAARFCRRAWSLLLDRVRAGGHRPSLILDRARLVNPGIQLALQLATAALVRREGDLWENRSRAHAKAFETLFGGLGALRYDSDEDGTAAEQAVARTNRRPWGV